MSRILFTTLLLLGLVALAAAIRNQAVGCKGRLMCGDRPAVGVKVKLWDEDDGPDPDDVLDETHTDSSGNFVLQGSTHELTSIDPVCKIYHDCDDGFKPGQRKIKLKIPSQYITSMASRPKRIFDIGVLNLETYFQGEERDLF
ncbi:hypothetical protein M3Y99_00264200 [Aphelenchoides fujianensis]|nr:hypothetical protein M3Y99_00264200 [Aphelenchoides fujianensis]